MLRPLSSFLPPHPLVRLAACVWVALAVQWAPWPGLLLLALWPLAWPRVGRQYLVLLRRSRFLLASLVLFFVLGTPGDSWFAGLPWVSREGLILGLEQGGRLCAMLAAVAGLLATTPPAAIATGLLPLLAPRGQLGRGATQALVRLLLVLEEGAGPRPRGQWRELLREPEPTGLTRLEVAAHPLSSGDMACLGLLGAGALGLVLA
ncbi:energy-coupling factor transporter transmembrane component T [Azospira inquinata]|uniref:Cobalt transport protein n=1 Tax=Azospira inquinata TaxID=2785627 RepID=A0A975SMG2_9RHOO|nr:energy-coupling factor transporter transmembrane component T [Azospira inquinata]QWT46132.1 hypothetical protein J8L76_00005 [Azospira inquinata]QWT48539.1 hypothetical protein Azoinq_11860 [Azospira inquinata]